MGVCADAFGIEPVFTLAWNGQEVTLAKGGSMC